MKSGLVYFNARYYDPTVGRFLTADPAENGVNWYAYVNDDPIYLVDRSGLLPTQAWGVLAMAGGVVMAAGGLIGLLAAAASEEPETASTPYVGMMLGATTFLGGLAAVVTGNPATLPPAMPGGRLEPTAAEPAALMGLFSSNPQGGLKGK